MRTFSDEIRLGTIEIIKTKPISSWDIILGKYFGSLILILIALLPTLTYVYTLIELAATPESVDFGSILGSYFGLLFLASSITAIGMFSSTLSDNQIVAFIFGIVLSFFMFYGFEAIGDLGSIGNFEIKNLGLHARFVNIGRGVIDSKDLVYFLSVTFFFLFLTKSNFDLKQ